MVTSERGNSAVAMIFLASSVIIGAALANLAVSVVVNLTAVNRSLAMTDAIEQRFGEYVSQMDAASGVSPAG
ncbi:MAG: hypothetical protein H7248_01550, partial [Microbacteriaceae bacterium]|nr:hypothetical protein [Microbacteriaceae bacterium]